MPSYLDDLLEVFDAARSRLTELQLVDYSPKDLNEVLTTVGSRLEIFLKVAAFPGGNPTHGLFDHIQSLRKTGIEKLHVDHLHDLRKSNNSSKHDPAFEASIAQVISVLSNARVAAERVGQLAVGRVNVQRPIALRRVFWIFAHDHYISGDTEVSIAVPGHDRGVPLDTIYIAIPEWESAIAELSTLGSLKMGTTDIPPSVLEWYRGEDFLNAGVFEGTYRDLLRSFAKRELRQQLLPGLNRHDDAATILQSAVLACVDIARGLSGMLAQSDLANEIVALASTDYAVPADSAELARVAADLASCITAADPMMYPSITGPSWVAPDEMERLKKHALASCANYGCILDQRGVFRIALR